MSPTVSQTSPSEPSPAPSPSLATAPALVLSNSGKRMDQAGKKKFVKQVTGRHNDTELHLAAQRGDLAAVKQILDDIDNQMVGTLSGSDFDAEVAEIRASVVNEVNELGRDLQIEICFGKKRSFANRDLFWKEDETEGFCKSRSVLGRRGVL